MYGSQYLCVGLRLMFLVSVVNIINICFINIINVAHN